MKIKLKLVYILLISLAFILSFSIQVEASWWDTDYNRRINLTINSSLIDSGLEYFPILVKLDSENFNFSAAASDGSDIRFVSADDTSLSFERARHDDVVEEAEYWVNIPSVSDVEDTEFYLYYGNSEVGDASSSDVWDANHIGVYHMGDETSSSISDSSIAGNGGNKTGQDQPQETTDAKVGLAQSYLPENEYIEIGTQGMDAAQGTMSVWFKLNNIDGVRYRFLGHVEPLNDWNNRILMGYDKTTGEDTDLYIGLGDTWNLDINLMTLSIDQWYHMALSYDSGSYSVYVDGQLISSGTYTGLDSIADQMDIGNTGRTDAERIYSPDGVIDEVRISNISRGDSWVRASFHSEENTLLDYGNIEEVPQPYFVEHDINSSIYLNPGTSKEVMCTGFVGHDDGLSSIDTISANFYNNNFSLEDPSNRTYSYEDVDCTTIDTDLNGEFECVFDVFFFARSGDWDCSVNVTDVSGNNVVSNTTTYIEEMIAIDVGSNSLDFGTQVPNTDTGSLDFPSEIYNEGNVRIDININTFAESDTDEMAMGCDVGDIPPDSMRFSINSEIDVFDRSYAPQSGTDVPFGLAPQDGAESSVPTSQVVNWGMILPNNVAGRCNGHIRYSAYN